MTQKPIVETKLNDIVIRLKTKREIISLKEKVRNILFEHRDTIRINRDVGNQHRIAHLDADHKKMIHVYSFASGIDHNEFRVTLINHSRAYSTEPDKKITFVFDTRIENAAKIYDSIRFMFFRDDEFETKEAKEEIVKTAEEEFGITRFWDSAK